MITKACVLILSTVVVLSDSSYLDSLKPCKIDDGKCQGALVQTVLKDISESGLPEIGLEPIDPVDVKSITVKILEIVDLTLFDGQLKGIKNSHVHKFGTNIEEGHTWLEIVCDLNLITKYKVFSSSPFIQGLTGGQNITGEGNGKVKIEKLKLNFDFYFTLEKKNGEIYVKYNHDKTTYSYKFDGIVSFDADNLYIGKEESSKTLVALMNQNSETMVENFSKHFIVKFIKRVYKFIHKFFDNVPTRYYISDDLSSYVK